MVSDQKGFSVQFGLRACVGRPSGVVLACTQERFASKSAFDTVSRLMKRNFFWLGVFLTLVFTMFAQERSPSSSAGDFDVIIHGGTVYDGTGAEPQQVDIAIRGDRIAGIGDFESRERTSKRSSTPKD